MDGTQDNPKHQPLKICLVETECHLRILRTEYSQDGQSVQQAVELKSHETKVEVQRGSENHESSANEENQEEKATCKQNIVQYLKNLKIIATSHKIISWIYNHLAMVWNYVANGFS